MQIPQNAFKRALRAGPPLIGLWLGLADAYAAEICAGSGFHWLLIDGEHAPNDVRSTLAQLQAVAPYASAPVVRAPWNEPVIIKRLLDLGAQSIMLPMVQSADEARAAVAAVRYPPEGIRGLGSARARASRWNRIADYPNTANAEMCVIVQIETPAGVAALDGIMAVEGVDAAFIGPADLSANMGFLGQPTHPQVLQTIDTAIARIIASGKAAGVLATDPAAARRYLDAGARFVAVGVDATLLARAADALAASFGAGEATETGQSGPVRSNSY